MPADPWAFGWTQLLTIIGLAITVAIALGGFRTFGRWRRETIEERRIDVALDALAIAYAARFRFEAIRSRVLFEGEGEETKPPKAAPEFIVITHRDAQKGPYAVLQRIRANEDFFEKVNDIEPKFMAIFGAETEKIFAALYQAKKMVESAAQALYEDGRIEHDPEDAGTREQLRSLRVDAFASSGKIEANDKVGQKILEFQASIEKLCRPIVDAKFGQKRKR